MNNFLDELQRNIEEVQMIVDKMENGESDMNKLRSYLPSMNQLIMTIMELSTDPNMKLELDHEFVLQVLNDIVYGVENEDPVFLQDVLQYGLLEIYNYIDAECRNGVIYE